LAAHAHLEDGLKTAIYKKIKEGQSPISAKDWDRVRTSIEPLVEALPFRKKVKMFEDYDGVTTTLIKALGKANKYRIEFAHPEGAKLRVKYNYSDPQSKQNIRDLMRALTDAKAEMNAYFSNA